MMQDLLKLQTLEFGETRGARIAAACAELRTKIPAPVLAHYDRLRTRGKKGLAAVRNQVCASCHMQLTLAVVMTLKQGHDVQLCQNCGRYLYLPEETAAVETPTPPPAKSRPAVKRRKKTAAKD
ncbi:MAG: hypothetical protein EXS35_18230 [Pedosphaera sp.]|nr:hypothetical protein [Pedosphaera sp.]